MFGAAGTHGRLRVVVAGVAAWCDQPAVGGHPHLYGHGSIPVHAASCQVPQALQQEGQFTFSFLSGSYACLLNSNYCAVNLLRDLEIAVFITEVFNCS